MLKKIEKNKIHTLFIFAITILIGVLFYILNYYTPLYGDDYLYSYSFATGEKMESITQIVDSLVSHYYDMNGRVVTHAFAQFFLMLGDSAFNIINTFFFLALLYLIYFHACGTFKEFSLFKFSFIASLLFLSTPAFGQSYLWITGASNYLYGILIILIVLVPYRMQANGKWSSNCAIVEFIFAILSFVFGIIAGWTNENTSVALIAMIIAYVVFFALKSIKIRLWNITGCVGAIVGCILMLVAPGNASRLDKLGGSGGIAQWIKRFVLYSCNMFVNLQLILLVLFVLVVIYLYHKQKKMGKISVKGLFEVLLECDIVFVYLLGFLASVYSMIVTPLFPDRVWSGPIVLILVAIFNLHSLIDKKDMGYNIGKVVALVFALVLCATTYINGYLDVKNVNSFYETRMEMIETAKENGEKSIGIPRICGGTKYSTYPRNGDLNPDSNEWPNPIISQYYGVEEIVCSN